VLQANREFVLGIWISDGEVSGEVRRQTSIENERVVEDVVLEEGVLNPEV